MSEQEALDLVRAFLMGGVLMGAPMIAAALVVGVIVGLLQALTSVQEMTLTFAPKILAMLAVFWLSASFMTGVLVDLFERRVLPVVAGG